MKIYIYDINLIDIKKMKQYFSMLQEDRIRKIERLKRDEDRKRSVAAGLVLKAALQREGIDYEHTVFWTDDNGKPYLKQTNNKKIYYNLSHSGDYAVAAVCDEEIGIDIERIAEYNEKVAKRCYTEREKQLIENNTEKREELYTTIWTLKESYLKATGEGIRSELNVIETEPDKDNGCIYKNNNRKAYTKILREIQKYIISVCSFRPIEEIEIIIID